MKKFLILSLILSTTLITNAESLFSLNASQSSTIEPKALFSSVRARGIGDLVSIVIDEAPAMSDTGTYSTQKQSSLAENLTKAFNSIFNTSFKDALNGTEGNLSVTGETQLSRVMTLTDTVVAQVVQVLPNGNLLVQGKKSLVNQNERLDLIISGIVDPKWINQSGEILSSQVANLQFAMNGAGTVSRGQNEGILDKAIRTIF
ncbi:MAG: flagellar basal body L-ring protein FlgH [Candidatus Gastranaerophilales bacterium]|nr:flagellar basal body L-ring protein FlgH [Candidatus Gastranaerophilales bacterium]